MLLLTEDLFSGKTYYTFVPNSEELLLAQSVMALPCSFWLDVWNGFFLQEKLPRLFTFAKDQKISVAAFLSTPDMSTLFHLPLSEQAYQEFQELQEIIQSVQMTQTDKDQWHYIWGSSKYTSKSFYNHLYKDFHPPKPFL